MFKQFFNTVPDLTLIVSIVASIAGDRYYPVTRILPYPTNLIGWLCIGIGVLYIFRILNFIRYKRASTNVSYVSSVLVTDGYFAISRNPLYVMYVLVTIGVAVILGSLTAFIGPLICFLVLDAIIIPFEESNLQEKFGQAYLEYRQRVRRWL